ncbi:TIR domain-containing protein [Bartonella sp. ML70XJBT]|uniref:TIR domain-containing protein n=1 Tax=Bartonella sp. ML70XJBT TaxID=3019096 RepID=UPI00235E2983|nr:TIR domain-containing protein [Bartonella sp. ML70XJBT]
MEYKYRGTFKDLGDIIFNAGYWILGGKLLQDKSPKAYRIETFCGGIVIWFESTGKIVFQGKTHIAKKLKEVLTPYLEETLTNPSPKIASDTSNKKIFIVHGHDHGSLTKLENTLLRLRLDPYILQNTSGIGLTIIETLKKEICKDSIGFSIVLLTPDDIGYARSDGETKAQFRARQNVIFEMGMLTAVLPLERIAILYKEGVELPSDVNGVYYLSFKEDVKETYLKLMKRLKAAGFHIDADAIDAL